MDNISRNSDGRFTVGTQPGPGRPPRSTEEGYLQAFQDSVSTEDFQLICKKAVEQAKQGNHAARKFIAEYGLGKPIGKEIKFDILGASEKYNLDLLTNEEIQLFADIYERIRVDP